MQEEKINSKLIKVTFMDINGINVYKTVCNCYIFTPTTNPALMGHFGFGDQQENLMEINGFVLPALALFYDREVSNQFTHRVF